MKVIKRDGRAVEYNREKIEIAIEKANIEVISNKRASKEEIKEIIDYIESLNKKRMLVEDIQDTIEQKLMEYKRYDLAKKYIVYRYTRALVRKQNTTDESILGIIRNENDELNKNILVSEQRNYIAGEVSRDLTKRLLLPEKITKAEEEGKIYFHNADYFIQPIINTSYINLKELLNTTIKINNYKIDSTINFEEACNKLLDIILEVANNQYGMQTIDITCLGIYLKEISEKEIDNCLKILKQHLSTIKINGKFALVKFLINVSNVENIYCEEIKILNKKVKEVFRENKNIFVENIDKKVKEKFDQGKVTINLVQPAIVANKSREIFIEELKQRLELCKDALMYKHYALLGTISDVSPILWQEGGIAKLNNGTKIDSLLKNGFSTLTLGVIGLDEATSLMEKCESKEKILDIIKQYIQEWSQETGIKFVFNDKCTKEISSKFLKIDRERFGRIKNITDKEYYNI